jgi:simple sugar transport system ATP-binding protein
MSSPLPEAGAAAVSESVLEAHDLRKAFGHVEALRGVSITLLKGEIHAVVGDNGAGKSTFLKSLSGAIQPDSGRVLLHGEEISLGSPLDAREAGIETVYQDLALADERSCTANVFMSRELVRGGLLGKIGWLDRRAMAASTREAFERLSVTIPKVSVPVRLLSGGQRQGVAIARAAHWAQHVLLLDEPTAALGVRQRTAVETLIRRLREHGYAILLISHDIPEVLKVADRISVLRQGRLVATKACAEVDTTWVITAMVEGNGS